MLIERIIREPGGSFVTMGGTGYHFKPAQDGGPHLAEVTDAAHAEVFLRISEGYRPFGNDNDKAGVDPAADAQKEITGLTGADAKAQQDNGGTPEPVAGTEFQALNDDELRTSFEDEVGRKPHARMLRETMIAQIVASRQEPVA